MTFGEKFKNLRLEKNLNQQEMVDEFNKLYGYTFTKSSISQYEHDKRMPEIGALKDFGLYFNVSVDYLLGKSNDRNKFTANDKVELAKDLLTFINGYLNSDNTSKDIKDDLFDFLSKDYRD
ncbi:helix-turn-helix domain-containing protein [Romboutsia lituseburensis]|uniref:helix-turn-helix domain-containing protein n=1 Tax=Romboutsia lituseburensis TaxID=1537 RepID=UPI00215A3658|nr:helix-turn-helix domain-containing protein [Romboutsia lituseburensis]MCR8746816.1 helix-turn-helix domain-containing protein [Romboutsia lituseburensis]